MAPQSTRKITPLVTTSFRIDKPTLDKLREVARSEDRTMNAQIRRAIHAEIERHRTAEKARMKEEAAA